MTADPEISPIILPKIPQEEQVVSSILEDIFYLGYATSEEMTVFEGEKDGKSIKIVAKFRTLMPAEIRDIFEEVQKYTSGLGQYATEQIETLARAIVQINGMRMVMDHTERAKMMDELRVKETTPLQEARYILTKKIRSAYMLDLLYEKYREFVDKVRDEFEKSKKKLNSPASSPSTSS